MRWVLVLLLLTISVCSADELTDRMQELWSQGKTAEARKYLESRLKQDDKDPRVRGFLARMLVYEGEADKAIKIAQDGIPLTQEVADRIGLLTIVGETALQRAEDGPSISRSAGTVTASPNQFTEKQRQTFVNKYGEIARKAYAEARKLDPANDVLTGSLAKTLGVLGRTDEAIVLWRGVLKKNPKNATACQQLAELLFENEKPDAATQILKDGLKLFPGNTEMLQRLAKHYVDTKHPDAEEWSNRYQFHERVPQFAELEFNEDNVARLKELQSAKYVETLLALETPVSAKWLATYCYMHPHNRLEDRAFVRLGDRKENRLLNGLLENATSSCTIRGAATQLARSKPPELLDRILPMLGRDVRSFGMHMDIANALDVLGDPRAVPSLIAALAPGNTKPNQNSAFADYDGARIRAALALGGFDSDKAAAALQKGLANPTLKVACAGGLLRSTGDEKYRKIIDTAAAKSDRRAWLVLYRLTKKLPEDKKLAATLKSLEARFEAEREKKEKASGGKCSD